MHLGRSGFRKRSVIIEMSQKSSLFEVTREKTTQDLGDEWHIKVHRKPGFVPGKIPPL